MNNNDIKEYASLMSLAVKKSMINCREILTHTPSIGATISIEHNITKHSDKRMIVAGATIWPIENANDVDVWIEVHGTKKGQDVDLRLTVGRYPDGMQEIFITYLDGRPDFAMLAVRAFESIPSRVSEEMDRRFRLYRARIRRYKLTDEEMAIMTQYACDQALSE